MKLRTWRLPTATFGLFVFSGVLFVWAKDTYGVRVGLREFIDSQWPSIAAAASRLLSTRIDSVEMLVAANLPARPEWADAAEMFGVVVLCGLAILSAVFRRPTAAAVLTVMLCLIWVAQAVSLVLTQRALIDAVGPPALVIVVFAATAFARSISRRRRNREVRQHLRQQLPADVVNRIADDPSALRLDGEKRDVTVMLTEIEGVAELMERADPENLMTLLRGYLDIVVEKVVAHGGMVVRHVGDGVFALFNAPLDLDDHPRRAIACAQAIVTATEVYRAGPLAKALSLGSTRIGIESGPAVVGDVGGSHTLDYIAQGVVVHTASRLKMANYAAKTAICVGPGAAARLEPRELLHKGSLAMHGSAATISVYTPVTQTI